ncbi:protein phosphatase 1 regulatory subunit 12A isoform X3 [Tachysurus fulvidraco]|uniref:protein phosphatase 1 regulatory subunit 12A isoform X3 n=1 Tax=Tachysurus fulvidraco TaxID=1234273 RepID=UPI000F50F071|nr:protein phosphatase 1 regulatory subunit 12A isoform X3 [Tachysurus fulvidraco]
MLDSSDTGKVEATILLEMSSYVRNKDPSSHTRKSILESPTIAPFSGNKSFRHGRSRGDTSEVESASETLGNTSFYTRRELDFLNKTTDFASKDYKKKQERTSQRPTVFDSEKMGKQVLEKRVTEMEEDIKVLAELKSDNQHLKDENGALIRVISKLSK